MDLTPYQLARLILAGRVMLAALGVWLGFKLANAPPMQLGGILLVVISGRSLIRNFGALVRVSVQGTATRPGGPGGRDPLQVPRQLLALLYAVATADGPAGPRELTAVQQFLLHRFPDPRLVMLLSQTPAKPLEERELRTLLRELRQGLSAPECQTVFTWCALVALIDHRFDQREHAILQVIATELRLDPHEARLLFHAAKHQVMSAQNQGGQQRRANWQGGSWEDAWRQAGGGGGPARPDPAAARRDAFETLGLDESATADDIRKRHRELAKKHHPDAHSHLGEIAKQEATERFRKIQAAYETLRESA